MRLLWEDQFSSSLNSSSSFVEQSEEEEDDDDDEGMDEGKGAETAEEAARASPLPPTPAYSKARLLGELGIYWGNWRFFCLFCSPGFCGVECLLRALSSFLLPRSHLN